MFSYKDGIKFYASLSVIFAVLSAIQGFAFAMGMCGEHAKTCQNNVENLGAIALVFGILLTRSAYGLLTAPVPRKADPIKEPLLGDDPEQPATPKPADPPKENEEERCAAAYVCLDVFALAGVFGLGKAVGCYADPYPYARHWCATLDIVAVAIGFMLIFDLWVAVGWLLRPGAFPFPRPRKLVVFLLRGPDPKEMAKSICAYVLKQRREDVYARRLHMHPSDSWNCVWATIYDNSSQDYGKVLCVSGCNTRLEPVAKNQLWIDTNDPIDWGAIDAMLDKEFGVKM